MENVQSPATEPEPVQPDAPATEPEPATFTCGGCSEEIPEHESCDHCYYCDSCDEMHDPDNTPYCSSCEDRYRRAVRYGWRLPRYQFRCEDSCEDCWYCEGCSERHDSDNYHSCNNCDSCTENHNCYYCDSCGEYRDPEDMCGDSDCDQCHDHCECSANDEDEDTGHGGQNPAFLHNEIKFWIGKPTATMPSRRTVAAEIEVARGGRGAYAPINAWNGKIVRDGSVTGGYEINTSPATGDKWESQITEICDALNRDNAAINTNCGLHIHVGAHDFGYMDHIRLLWAWQTIEHAVFACLPDSRQENQYCMKRASQIARTLGAPRELRGASVRRALVAAIRDGGDVPHSYQFNTEKEYQKAHKRYVAALSSGKPWISKVTLENFRPFAVKGKRQIPRSPGGTRYYALNLQALFEHGTVEFRCHAGTTDPQKIRNWGQLCASLVDFAKRANIAKLRDFCAMDSFDAMLSLVPTEDQKAYWRARLDRFDRY